MNFAPPSAKEAARLLAEFAYRHPEKASLEVVGDRGAPVRLPILLGNPTGACRLPSGMRPSPAWQDSIAVTLRLRRVEDSAADLLGADCVVWPAPGVWAEWVERWPALTGRVAELARQKMGGVLDAVVEPAANAKAPEAVDEALAGRPRAVWRIVNVPSTRLDLAIDAPTGAVYDAFLDAVRKPDADLWRLCGDLVRACVPVVVANGGAMPVEEVLDRWPGLGVVLIAVVAQLAGAGAKARMGEW